MNRLKEKKETLKGALKKLAVFISVLFVMTAASGLAVLADTYGDFEYSVDGDKVTITKYNGEGGDVVIPGTIEGKSVTSIGDWAFFGCEGLTSVDNKSNCEIELPGVDGYVWKDGSGTVITSIKNGVATRFSEGSGENGGENGGNGDKILPDEGLAFSEPVTVTVGEYSVSYNRIVTFFGKAKKFKTEAEIENVFGEIRIVWQGETHKATSIKVVKKNGNNYIQILKTDKSDKNFNKGLKKLTKGTSGLSFTIKPLKITKSNSKALVNVKKGKGNKVKAVIVTTKGPGKSKDYKASKKTDYSVSGTTITFKGENLEGSCSF